MSAPFKARKREVRPRQSVPLEESWKKAHAKGVGIITKTLSDCSFLVLKLVPPLKCPCRDGSHSLQCFARRGDVQSLSKLLIFSTYELVELAPITTRALLV